MRKINIFLLCICVISSCHAQQRLFKEIKTGKPYSAKGYLINLYGKNGAWIFQPSSDSLKNIINSLNGVSFKVQNISNDLGYTFFEDLEGLGNKIKVSIYDNIEKAQKTDTLMYLYCRINLEVLEAPYRLDSCTYMLTDLRKNLSCIFFQNYLTEVEPLDAEIRRKYLQLFNDNGWPLPHWARANK